MPTGTPAQNFPIPTSTDDPDVVSDMGALALAIEKRVFGVYNDVADRNTKVASPQEGQIAYTKADDKVWIYQTISGTSAWNQFPTAVPAITSGTTVPANSSGNNGDVFFKV